MTKTSKKETEAIRYLVHQRLTSRRHSTAELAPESHLDDDTVAAFLEARLSENESVPVISHLVACDACRKLTAQLVSFDSDLDGSTVDVAPQATGGSLRQWFEDFKAGLSSSNEEVFAYQNPPETKDDIRHSDPDTIESTPDAENKKSD